MMKTILSLLLLISSNSLLAAKQSAKTPIEQKQTSPLRSLYNTLDPFSIQQHLAFYELYSDSPEGQKALRHVWEMLYKEGAVPKHTEMLLPKFDLRPIISLITRQPTDPPIVLSEEMLQITEKISKQLANRRLKGRDVWSKKEVLDLPSEEIDLARGLLLNQFENSLNIRQDIRQYEASLDLMALQILVRLKKDATHEDKIREINRFIFQEMQFRFPPHSLYAKDIDLYTFLPSVLDSRKGVCLGVSILYLCLAQRLDLPLDIITPPGHIYLSYSQGKEKINIETTARGINLPDEMYLGINTRRLQKRTMKEVIGLAFINEASVYWGKEDYQTTVALYEKAIAYLPNDPLIKMFLGLNYLFIGKKTEGKKLLEHLRNFTFDYAVSPESIPEDLLSGKIDADGVKAIFAHVDETRASILDKQQKLQKILARYPHFRAGQLQLAITWMQLGRQSETLNILQRYHKIDPNDATIEYYLSMLSLERLDYNKAWEFAHRAEALTSKRDHHPRALKAVKDALKRVSPEPKDKRVSSI